MTDYEEVHVPDCLHLSSCWKWLHNLTFFCYVVNFKFNFHPNITKKYLPNNVKKAVDFPCPLLLSCFPAIQITSFPLEKFISTQRNKSRIHNSIFITRAPKRAIHHSIFPKLWQTQKKPTEQNVFLPNFASTSRKSQNPGSGSLAFLLRSKRNRLFSLVANFFVPIHLNSIECLYS